MIEYSVWSSTTDLLDWKLYLDDYVMIQRLKLLNQQLLRKLPIADHEVSCDECEKTDWRTTPVSCLTDDDQVGLLLVERNICWQTVVLWNIPSWLDSTYRKMLRSHWSQKQKQKNHWIRNKNSTETETSSNRGSCRGEVFPTDWTGDTSQ